MPVHSKYRDARITILSALNRTTSAGLGTRGLAILRGHRIANVDFAVSKYFPIHERMRLQFRMNAVNVLNHPNFALPASNISSPATVGRIPPVWQPHSERWRRARSTSNCAWSSGALAGLELEWRRLIAG